MSFAVKLFNDVTSSAAGALVDFGIFFGIEILVHACAAMLAAGGVVDVEDDEDDGGDEAAREDDEDDAHDEKCVHRG